MEFGSLILLWEVSVAEKNSSWVISVLREAVEEVAPKLREKARKLLCAKDVVIWDHCFCNHYLKVSGRWYDLWHFPHSTSCAVRLVKESKGGLSPLVVPAVILHDSGYYATGTKYDWRSANSRIAHMQEGAAFTAWVLSYLLCSAHNCYSPIEIGQIVGIVGSHDNGYLGIQEIDPDRLAVRDADRLLVMSFVSFWKDWAGWAEKIVGFSPADLLRIRRASFFNNPPDRIVSPELKSELHYQPITTDFAAKMLEEQFLARAHDGGGIILNDPDAFRKRAIAQMEKEFDNVYL